ncbi:PTS transporter subunit EIIB [Vibrio profundi]|uniref:PTS transporter subunit EIIB n=1 Tax=Vibrio profundi TaxID=1774960 RepID=UPI003735136A
MIKDKGDLTAKANKIILGLGGKENIVEGNIDNCATRLRIQVHNTELVNERLLRRQGALGFINLPDNHIQVVFLNVHPLAHEIRQAQSVH